MTFHSFSISKIKLSEILYSLLFFCIIIFPASLYIVKIALLGLILVLKIFFLNSIKKTILHSREIIILLLLLITSNVFFITYGEFLGNDAIRFYFPIDVIWFFLYCIIFITMDSNEFFLVLNTIFFAVKIVFILGIISFFVINMNPAKSFLFFKGAVRPGYPFLAISAGSITNVIFIGSMLLLYCLERKERFSILVIEILFIIATSRRALMLNVVLVFFIYISLSFFCAKNKDDLRRIKKVLRILFGMIFFVIISLVIYDNLSDSFDLQNFVKFFKNAFKLQQSFEKNVDNSSFERGKQAISLYHGWLEHLVLGNGTAANASVVRSDVPGMYELTYLAILFQRGIIGFLIYFSGFLYSIFYIFTYAKKLKKIRKFLIIIVSAFICFLIANGTNPYLQAFDFLWVMFVPMVIVKLIQFDDKKFEKSYNERFVYA